MSSSSSKTAREPIDRRRRRHERYRADFRATVSRFLGNDYQKIEGHCRDLSQAGIGILLATELNVGDVVGLNFLLPGSEIAWELRAVVRYRHGYHYGFEFLSMAHDRQEPLRDYLRTLEPAS
jgi:hypothetical protein